MLFLISLIFKFLMILPIRIFLVCVIDANYTTYHCKVYMFVICIVTS